MGQRAGRAAGPQEAGPLDEAGTACLAGAGGMERKAVRRELKEKYLLKEMPPETENEGQKYPGFSLSSAFLFFCQCLPFLKTTWVQRENLESTFSYEYRPEQRKMRNVQIWEPNRQMNDTVQSFCCSAPFPQPTPYLTTTVYRVPQDMAPGCSSTSFPVTVPIFSLLSPCCCSSRPSPPPNPPTIHLSSAHLRGLQPGPCSHLQLFGWELPPALGLWLRSSVPGTGQLIQFLILGLSLNPLHVLEPRFSIKAQPQALGCRCLFQLPRMGAIKR